ncbi:SH3 domain-containing protein [Micropruina sp.]|uniref:SH3 domain-containing protein n=1 Tax=Micropruina sp. TaxID=2737536 RepID=UPI0039E70855
MGQRTSATTRTLIAVVTSVALSFSLGGLLIAGSASAAVAYVATGAVNVRSGPGTSYSVLGVLHLGDSISGTSTSNGWVQVTFEGANAYVSASYLKQSATATATASATTTTGTAGTKVTTADLNLRSGPSLEASVVKVIAKGTTVSTTGTVTGTFAQVTIDGATNWLSTKYLADAATTTPAIAYRAVTTAALAMRATPQIEAKSAGTLKAGSTVSLTGTHSESYSQIVNDGAVLWVLTGYLNTEGQGTDVPVLPTSAGKRYVAVDEVNIRATSASDGKVVGSATEGTVLTITGKTASSRSEVIYNGERRWAYSSYLSKTQPSASSSTSDGGSLGSTSLDRTNAYIHVIVREIRAEFPQIKTMYGWRMYSAYSSDHPSGRALDIMIPKYKTSSGISLGNKIARYLQDNYKRLHVHYLIWRQRQWNVERNTNPTTGWRKMSDRGGATANHMDHVHVSVYAP